MLLLLFSLFLSLLMATQISPATLDSGLIFNSARTASQPTSEHYYVQPQPQRVLDLVLDAKTWNLPRPPPPLSSPQEEKRRGIASKDAKNLLAKCSSYCNNSAPSIDDMYAAYNEHLVFIHPDDYPHVRRNDSIVETRRLSCPTISGGSNNGVPISRSQQRYPQYHNHRHQHHLHHVRDPYRWLEEPSSSSNETLTFIHQLNSMSGPFFAGSPARERLRAALTHLRNQSVHGCLAKHGPYYYFWQSSALRNQPVLHRRRVLGTLENTREELDDKESLEESGDLKNGGEEEIFLDPNRLSLDGIASVRETAFSRDGTIMAYTVSEKGADEGSIRFRDMRGKDLSDVIPHVKHTSLAWVANDGVFYTKFANKKANGGGEHRRVVTGTERDEYHSLFFHKIGTTHRKDILLADFRELGNPNLFLSASVSADGRMLFVYVYNRDSSNSVYYFDLLDSGDYRTLRPPLNLTLLVHDQRSFFTVVDYERESASVLMLTNRGAPMQQLVRMRLETARQGSEQWETVIEEDPKRTLTAVSPVAGRFLIAQYMEDAKTTLHIYDRRSGRPLYRLQLGGNNLHHINNNNISAVSGGKLIGDAGLCYARQDDTEAFFSFSTFLHPPRYFHADFRTILETGGALRLEELHRVNNSDHTAETIAAASNFVVRQKFYRSRDGTRVPLYLVHHRRLALDGSNPTLLYGYGGFSIPLLPHYSAERLLFLSHFRGVLAVANIRGGGEYGEHWHEAGRLHRKHNSFDDFISAAEYLIERRYTSPKRLAIQGGSNGGLLMAVCSQRRPELFGAVINQVGVLDMLRFHKFTVGASWIPEYGDPEKAADFEYLLGYSPLHNVRHLARGAQWPATLLMTADHDDRVVPAHTLKYAAELYHYFRGREMRHHQRNPVLVRVETDAGHGAGLSTAKSIEESVDIMSFLQRVLQIRWWHQTKTH